jgi:hypothetical protein
MSGRFALLEMTHEKDTFLMEGDNCQKCCKRYPWEARTSRRTRRRTRGRARKRTSGKTRERTRRTRSFVAISDGSKKLIICP